MALKSVYKIDVDDSQFQKFKTAFAEHQEQMGRFQPNRADTSADEAKKRFSEGQIANWNTLNALQDKGALGADRFQKGLSRSIDPLEKLKSITASVEGSIGRATSSLMKWIGISSLVSGLLTIGGVDHLAAVASGARRSAMGLGISPGDQAAFNLNFRRLVNPDQLLGGVATAKSNPASTERRALLAMGFSNAEIESSNPADLAARAIPRARGLFDRYGGSQLAADATGLTSLFGMEDLRRLHGTSSEEINRLGERFNSDRRGLNMRDEDLVKWQDFNDKLDRAGQLIEKTFINGLVSLTGPIGDFAASIAHFTEIFINSPTVRRWIIDLTDGLQHLATWIASPQFETGVTNFLDQLNRFALAIESAARWFTSWFGPRQPADPAHPQAPPHRNPDGSDPRPWFGPDGFPPWHPLPEVTPPAAPGNDNQPAAPPPPFHWYDPRTWRPHLVWDSSDPGSAPPATAPGTPAPPPPPGTRGWGAPTPVGGQVGLGPAGPGMFSAIEAADGLPAGVLWNIYGNESSHGTANTDRENSAHALGPFQFLPGTWQDFGTGGPDNRRDLGQAAIAAGNYMRHLMQLFHGDVAMASAAYNMGEGALGREIAQWGDQWREHLSADVRDYADRATRGVGGVPAAPRVQMPPDIRVHITQAPGANVIATVNQLPR